jgi:hypothetical protein
MFKELAMFGLDQFIQVFSLLIQVAAYGTFFQSMTLMVSYNKKAPQMRGF